jgi:hypothetical protein
MLKAGDIVFHDKDIVRKYALKLIKSDFKEKTTHDIAREINRLTFNEVNDSYHYYNCIRLVKLINQDICEYYAKEGKSPEEIVNHDLLIYIKLINSLINKYHNM